MFHRALANRITTTLIVTIAGLTVLSLSAGSSHVLGAAPIQTRLSIATGETHPYYPGAVKFKEVLETESKGQIQVQIFPNAQAGDEAASLALIRSGSLQFAEHSSSLASSSSNEPRLQAWSLPFLYPDAEAAYRAWDSDLAAKSYAAFEKSGFKCLTRWDAGFRQLSANRPVNSVNDVRGLKVRTPDGAIYVSTWKALGAVPTPMAFTELYTALQTGVVDGTELPVQVFASSKFYEVQKNYAVINYMNDPICFSVSLRFFNGLSRDLQQAVMKAAQASAVANRQAAGASFDKATDQVKAAGVKITRPDTEPFRKAVATVYEDFYKKAGEEARGVVNAIIQLTKK
ncbi:MAG: TRAP transporter substrate-binding protein [Candidatus Rokubacteria bacterium]|nr:TRAP transporter substrate-binding protein [Candidatus Rokubacteria bacterium]